MGSLARFIPRALTISGRMLAQSDWPDYGIDQHLVCGTILLPSAAQGKPRATGAGFSTDSVGEAFRAHSLSA
jgi:hypothetical protein